MLVSAARSAAIDWVARHARGEEGFWGSYFSGSTVGKPGSAELAPGSDVDVVIVTAGEIPEPKIGKVAYRDALLDVTHLPRESFSSPEAVLSSYHLAGGLRTDSIIDDAAGELRALQREVARRFADIEWVRRRAREAYLKAEAGLRGIDPAAAWPDQVTAWLFGTGVLTHVVLSAAMRNPTIRLRYLAAGEVLAEFGEPALYEELLDLLGCADLGPDAVLRHHENLARTFDRTAAVARTPFFFSSDITPAARAVAVDGIREVIDRGKHREAVFWMVATYARCHKILLVDGTPGLRRELVPAFDDLLGDLKIGSTADLVDRAGVALRFMPALWRVAESMMSAGFGREEIDPDQRPAPATGSA